MTVLLGTALVLSGCRDRSPDERHDVYQVTGDTLSASLRLSIGAAEGVDAVVKVFSAFRRDDRIFLANGIDAEIREYDLSGKLIRRVGRRGHGPGEFVELTRIAPFGADSLVALDRSASRVTVLDSNLSYARSFQLPVVIWEPVDWIAEYGAGFAVGLSHMPNERAMSEATRDSFVVALIDPNPTADLSGRRLLPPIPGRWWRSPGPGHLVALEDGPYALVAVRNGRILASTSDSPEILSWNGNAWDSIAVGGKHGTNGYLKGHPGVLRRLYDALVLEQDGGFWLGEAHVNPDGLRTWKIFEPNGSPKSVVRLPRDLVVWQVDDTLLLGKSTTGDGVEYVQLWEFSR